MFEVPYVFYEVVSSGAEKPEDYVRIFESDWEAFAYFSQTKNNACSVLLCVVSEKDGQSSISKTSLVKKRSRRK